MRPSKRDELVAKALNVFETEGFHASGVDRVAAVAGVSKTSIYNHFRSKEELILAALRLKDERFESWLLARIEALAEGPEGRLLAIFDALDEWFRSGDFRGCTFIKAAAEYQEAADPIRRQAAAQKQAIRGHVVALASAAGFSPPEALADRLMLLIEGAIIAAQMEIVAAPAATARQAAETMIATAPRDPASL